MEKDLKNLLKQNYKENPIKFKKTQKNFLKDIDFNKFEENPFEGLEKYKRGRK